MSMILKEKTTNYEPIEEGTYPAVCVGLYDIGYQYSEKYDKSQRKVIIAWEIMDDDIGDETEGETKHRTISATYTFSFDPKATLRKVLKRWRGREFTEEELDGFDLKNVLGVSCQVQILHSKKEGNTYI